MNNRIQLWLQKTSNWVMVGFFDSSEEAMAEYDRLKDGATTDFKLVHVTVLAEEQ